jgi:hypothetical protein
MTILAAYVKDPNFEVRTVASKLGMSRQRIFHVLKDYGWNKERVKRVETAHVERRCPVCGKAKGKRNVVCKGCSAATHHLVIAGYCKWCRRKIVVMKRYVDYVTRPAEFCSKRCQGKYMGRHFGFGNKESNAYWSITEGRRIKRLAKIVSGVTIMR